MMKRIALGVLLVVCMLSAGAAFADSITFSGTTSNEQGTGLGNRLYLLNEQNNGSEQGAVIWNGTAVTYPSLTAGANDVKQLGPCAGSGSSSVCSIAQLTAAGITASNLVLVFQVNQQGSGGGNSLTLNNVSLYVWSAGGTLLETINCSTGCPGTYQALGQGSAGFVFNVSGLSPWFGNSTNLISLGFSAGPTPNATNDGADNWYITSHTPGTSLPEPASFALLGSGLLGLGGLARRKK